MQGHRLRNSVVVAVSALVLGLGVGVVITLRAEAADPLVTASVGSSPSGSPLPAGFVGVSLEFNWLHFYTGRNPKRINPVFVALVRNLAANGQTPIVRIGGESTDATWWPIRRERAPQGISYSLGTRWLRGTICHSPHVRNGLRSPGR